MNILLYFGSSRDTGSVSWLVTNNISLESGEAISEKVLVQPAAEEVEHPFSDSFVRQIKENELGALLDENKMSKFYLCGCIEESSWTQLIGHEKSVFLIEGEYLLKGDIEKKPFSGSKEFQNVVSVKAKLN
jgi:hypothetical protein